MPEYPSPTASAVANALKPLPDRLKALVGRLTALGDKPVPAELAKDLGALAATVRQSVAPTPPSATTEKNENADTWPKDLADELANELAWGRDPEGLHA